MAFNKLFICSTLILLVIQTVAKCAARQGCLVGDIMHMDGDSIGCIGLECINATSFIGLESFCADGNIIDIEKDFNCPADSGVPYCIQCGPSGWGAALCLSSDDPDQCN